ncbi:MAG: competence type IV pilus major pilin ComGC [Megasphaera sp.]|uniref:competence type IV pilus major pilin ComGC n=1 Tax=Megasphaera sp. TaxID=2023260 RepID=UPI003F016F2E
MKIRNGFSLLEMLICVSIILIFASFAVPRFSSATKTAQEAKVQADIRTISNAAALYEMDHGTYPSSIDELVTKGSDGKQYLQFKPLTPDKAEYQIADGVVSADFNNKHFSSDASGAQEVGG